MEDMERYGDYNDPEEEAVPHKRNVLFIFVKWLLVLVIALVVGLLGYRLFLFEHYPKDVKQFILTEQYLALREDGTAPSVKTQQLRFPYDDNDLDTRNSNDLGTFFANFLYICEESGELQITLRINDAGFSDIAARFDMKDADAKTVAEGLSFRLTDNYGRVYSTLSMVHTTEFAMYHYYKLCFSGIDFTEPSDGLGSPEWIRIEVLFFGEDKPYSYMLIYENNEDYSSFRDYAFTGKEPTYLDY